MKEIPLRGKYSLGKYAKVSDEDYEELSKKKWYVSPSGYAGHNVVTKDGHYIEWMHRIVLNAPAGTIVDHRDQDKLNNQRENLRLCTHSENHANTSVQPNCTSGYRGVAFHKASGKWQAHIKHMNKNVYLGLHLTKRAAAEAYNAKALELFGSFASLNVIKETDDTDLPIIKLDRRRSRPVKELVEEAKEILAKYGHLVR